MGHSVLREIVQQFEGKTPDQIAEVVRKHKIKGRMGTTYKCPMALLLDGISTGRYVIGRRYIARQSGASIERVRTPDGVAAFVRKFDIGGYPGLISPPPRCVAKPGDAPPRKRRGRGQRTRPPIKNHLSKLVGRFHEKGVQT